MSNPDPSDNGQGDAPPKDDQAAGYGSAYGAILVGTAVFGAIAVVVGVGGTFVVLTGGSGGPSTNSLDGFVCESVDGDPQVVHETDYEVEQRIFNPGEVATFNGTVRGEQVRVSLNTSGPLLAASATELSGRPVDIDVTGDRIRVNRSTTAPFRLWVDSVSEDGSVTRMRLDICPAEAA